MIDLHACIVGATGSGKGYFSKKYFLTVPDGVLFFNTILDSKDWTGWVKVNGRTNTGDIITALNRGQKLVYNPDPGMRDLEFLGLMEIIGRNRDVKVRLVLDEVADLMRSDECRQELIKIGEYGRHFNTKYAVISQRFQKIHKDITSQCDDMIIFKTNMERQYMKSMGIDIDTFADGVREPYHYAHIKNGELVKVDKV